MRRRVVIGAVVAGVALGAAIVGRAIPTTGSRLDEARALALERKVPEAIAAYRAILAALPPAGPTGRGERVEALSRLGDLLYLHAGEPTAAADAYRRLILEAPAHREAWEAREKLADIARHHLRDLHEAIAHEQALAASGQAGADRFGYRVAKGYFELGEYEQCRREARTLLDGLPESEWADDALMLVATTFQLEGKHGEAIGAFRELMSRFPGTESAARALHGIAGEQVALGELDEALATYLAVLPDHPEPERVQPDIARVRRLIAADRERKLREEGQEAGLAL